MKLLVSSYYKSSNINGFSFAEHRHNIFNGVKTSSQEVYDFKKLCAGLAAKSIESIVIKHIDKESYTVEYMERQTRKSMKILISEIQAI